MKGRSSGRVVGLALVVLAAACASAFQQPEISVAGVRLDGIGLTGGRIEVRLEVDNPNGFDLEAERLRYDLDLEDGLADDRGWIDFADGTVDGPIRVPARDRTVVEIPVSFRYRTVGVAVRALLERGSFDFRLRGTVELRRPVGRDVEFRHQGAVGLDGLGGEAVR